jgi:hypothetical protein
MKGTIPLSSTEAEFISLCECVKEILWIKPILEELNIPATSLVFEDNIPTINFCLNPQSKGRCKHTDVKLQFIKDIFQRKEIVLQHINTNENIADILTKPLAYNKHSSLRSKMIK